MKYLVLIITIITPIFGQFNGCDYHQYLDINESYNVVSPNYPYSYNSKTYCRWTAEAPIGYTVILNCNEIYLPPTLNCTSDRLEISLTGKTDLSDANPICGIGEYLTESLSNSIVIALVIPSTTSGGRFKCTVQANRIPQCSCGHKKVTRIVGGTETLVNEYPMMAGLIDLKSFKVSCGTTLISKKYGITAGHCVKGKNATNFALLVGDHNYDIGNETIYSNLYLIEKILIHEEYQTVPLWNDIALVKTVKEIVFNAGVGAVCLPFKFKSTNFTGTETIFVGWGSSDFGEPISNTLMKSYVKVIENLNCQSQLLNITTTQICTYSKGADACQSDSGGPLFYTDSLNRVYNIGIISYGIGCASTHPAVNTRVTEFLDWIIKNTPEEVYCNI